MLQESLISITAHRQWSKDTRVAYPGSHLSSGKQNSIDRPNPGCILHTGVCIYQPRYLTFDYFHATENNVCHTTHWQWFKGAEDACPNSHLSSGKHNVTAGLLSHYSLHTCVCIYHPLYF